MSNAKDASTASDSPRRWFGRWIVHGENNPIDGMVLEVLLRKHERIRAQLGISMPVPMEADSVVEAMFEGLLMREDAGSAQLSLDFIEKAPEQLELVWNEAAERERKSRSIFSQQTIKVDEVTRDLDAIHQALGDRGSVAAFVEEALRSLDAVVAPQGKALRIDLSEAPRDLREAVGDGSRPLMVAFEPSVADAEVLTRTHPLVAAVARQIWSRAFDSEASGPARRCGVVRTRDVDKRTTLLLLRLRYHIVTKSRDGLAAQEEPSYEDTMPDEPEQKEPLADTSPSPEPEEDDEATVYEAVLGWLEDRPGWHARAEILADIGLSVAEWNRVIGDLLETGEVEKKGQKRGTRYRWRGDVGRIVAWWLGENPGWHSRADVLEGAEIDASEWNKAIGDLVASGAVEKTGEKRGDALSVGAQPMK